MILLCGIRQRADHTRNRVTDPADCAGAAIVFTTVKGYGAYAQKIAMAREIGMGGIVSAFMEAAVWGTPERILRKREERRAVVGDFELATSFRFGGAPFDLADSGLRLYAKEVLPIVHAWSRAAREP